MSRAVCFDRELCLPLLLEHLPGRPSAEDFGSDFHCIGFLRGGTLEAAALFSGFQGFNVFFSIAAVSPSWATRANFRVICEFAFGELGVERITACVPGTSRNVHQLATRWGFRFEGIRRKGWDGNVDLFEFGMLRGECRWLQQAKD